MTVQKRRDYVAKNMRAVNRGGFHKSAKYNRKQKHKDSYNEKDKAVY